MNFGLFVKNVFKPFIHNPFVMLFRKNQQYILPCSIERTVGIFTDQITSSFVLKNFYQADITLRIEKDYDGYVLTQQSKSFRFNFDVVGKLRLEAIEEDRTEVTVTITHTDLSLFSFVVLQLFVIGQCVLTILTNNQEAKMLALNLLGTFLFTGLFWILFFYKLQSFTSSSHEVFSKIKELAK